MKLVHHSADFCAQNALKLTYGQHKYLRLTALVISGGKKRGRGGGGGGQGRAGVESGREKIFGLSLCSPLVNILLRQ